MVFAQFANCSDVGVCVWFGRDSVYISSQFHLARFNSVTFGIGNIHLVDSIVWRWRLTTTVTVLVCQMPIVTFVMLWVVSSSQESREYIYIGPIKNFMQCTNVTESHRYLIDWTIWIIKERKTLELRTVRLNT